MWKDTIVVRQLEMIKTEVIETEINMCFMLTKDF